MVICLNYNSECKALVLYKPTKNLKFKKFFNKLNLALINFFRPRRKCLFVSVVYGFVFVLLGVHLSLSELSYPLILYRVLSNERNLFICLLIFVLSGYSVFGIPLSIIFNMIISFAIGNLLNASFLFNYSEFFYPILVLFIYLLSFLLSCEVYLLSKRVIKGSGKSIKNTVLYILYCSCILFLLTKSLLLIS